MLDGTKWKKIDCLRQKWGQFWQAFTLVGAMYGTYIELHKTTNPKLQLLLKGKNILYYLLLDRRQRQLNFRLISAIIYNVKKCDEIQW